MTAGSADSIRAVPSSPDQFKGRGSSSNPGNRFESIRWERDEDWDPSGDPAPATEFYRDSSQSIIAYNESPDLGFSASVNPYRGCEHGCIYCYARPTHEYLGFSAGLDFESRIMVKERAPELLRRELAARKWRPQVIAMSGVTDCYQPVERRLKITRGCLEVLADFRNPVGVVTKNHLVKRDLDVLGELSRHQAALLIMTVTSLDRDLASRLEPRTSMPEARLQAIEAARAAGVPAGILVAPVIPGLNDHEIPEILQAAARAGAGFAAYVMLRLPYGVKELFADWLEREYPERKEKVLGRLRAMRGGKLNDSRFGSRMKGEGAWADQCASLFEVACRKAGLERRGPVLSADHFRVPSSNAGPRQITFPF